MPPVAPGLGRQLGKFLRFEAVSLPIVLLTALLSYGLQLSAILSGQPLYAIVFLTLLPTLIVNSKQEDTSISARDYVGWGLWTAGFLFETIADYQKSAFRGNPDNAVSRGFNGFILTNRGTTLVYKLIGSNIRVSKK